jgi:cbb3-type cytochrome oxidase maturation protein
MDIILMLIPAALVISVAAFAVFYWSVKTDQYEDMDGEAHRILMDDDDHMIPGNKNNYAAVSDEESPKNESEQLKKSDNE